MPPYSQKLTLFPFSVKLQSLLNHGHLQINDVTLFPSFNDHTKTVLAPLFAVPPRHLSTVKPTDRQE